MSDPASAFPVGGPHRPVGEVGKGQGQPQAAEGATSSSFKALLESLEQKAAALDEKSRTELQPEDLAAAVEEARSSFEDALALQNRLLEAWRQSQHQRPIDPTKATGPTGQGDA